MSGQLSWTREGETLALHGELDQDLLVPLWEARAQATAGTCDHRSQSDHARGHRGPGAVSAFCGADSPSGPGKRSWSGKSENAANADRSLQPACRRPDLINLFSALALKLSESPGNLYRRGFLLV